MGELVSSIQEVCSKKGKGHFGDAAVTAAQLGCSRKLLWSWGAAWRSSSAKCKKWRRELEGNGPIDSRGIMMISDRNYT